MGASKVMFMEYRERAFNRLTIEQQMIERQLDECAECAECTDWEECHLCPNSQDINEPKTNNYGD